MKTISAPRSPSKKVRIFNRDGTLGSRLANFTRRVLDVERRDVYQSLRNPAPAVKAEFAVRVGLGQIGCTHLTRP